MKSWRFLAPIFGLLLLLWLTACGSVPTVSEKPAQPEAVKTISDEAKSATENAAEAPALTPTPLPTKQQAPAPTQAPAAAPSTATAPLVTPTPDILFLDTPIAQATLSLNPAPSEQAPPASDGRIVQVEWPERIRMGESDVVRLALIPNRDGFELITEFPEHQTLTQTIQIPHPSGYELFAVARLEGVGFEIAPDGEQAQYLPTDRPLTWRWSLTPRRPGQQRLTISLTLRWETQSDSGPVRSVVAYSRALEVQVISFLGLSRNQALLASFVGLFLGGSMSLAALVLRPQGRKQALRILAPNLQLQIDLPAQLELTTQERSLLQGLFGHYARLIIEQEFLSGYSGARTFLSLPVRPDGRADAYTIAKLGELESIRNEFANYEAHVKDTLPPITARIQHTPVTTHIAPQPGKPKLAALQYTFIGEPGSTPTSLRQALLKAPDLQTQQAFLHKLFDTFGPNWWLQRRPYTFRLAQEYDRLLPTHLVLEPVPGLRPQLTLDGNVSSIGAQVDLGDIVTIRNFPHIERRVDGRSLSLAGAASPPLRLRWLSLQHPEGATGRVVDTRFSLLNGFVQDYTLPTGLPDPFTRLPAFLAETINGSQSTIHGDLNLENILVGPGNLLWLIDFAQTRDGHTLLDFAHLYAELVAHILAPQIADPAAYLALLRHPDDSPYQPFYTLLSTVDDIAGRCLFHPSQPREWQIARALACLGALKYANLNAHIRRLLYLTGAYLLEQLPT